MALCTVPRCPVGFLKVLDKRRIAYADFFGNRQYISAGNLSGDGRVSLILMDYAQRRRLKILGQAELIDVSDDPALVAELHDQNYEARPERAVVITIDGYDWNCPQHITPRFTEAEFADAAAPMEAEIRILRQENGKLRAALDKS